MAIDADWIQQVYAELLSRDGLQDIMAGRADLGRYFAPDVVIHNFEGHPAEGPFHGHAASASGWSSRWAASWTSPAWSSSSSFT